MWEKILKDAGQAANRQDWAGAESILRKATEKPDVPPVIWFQLGKILFVQKKLDQAATAFHTAAQAAPNLADGWLELGRTLAAAGRFKEAYPPLQRATELKPDDAQAHRFASVAARESGDIETGNYHAGEVVRLGEELSVPGTRPH